MSIPSAFLKATTLSLLAASGLLYQVVFAQNAPGTASPAACTITGRVVTGNTPVPGATVTVDVEGERRGQVTTDTSGTFALRLMPSGHYRISAEQTFFTPAVRDLVTSDSGCDQTVTFALALAARERATVPSNSAPGRAAANGAVADRGAARAGRDVAGDGAGTTAGDRGSAAGGRASVGRGPAAAAAGRGAAPGAGGRFATLTVEETTTPLDETTAPNDAEVARLLPPGFSADAAASDAVAINGSGDATTVDRRMMDDRLDAIGRGEFDPATGAFAAGFGPGGPGGRGGFAGRGAGPGGFGPGGFGPGNGGPGGPGFFIGGRGGAQNAYHGGVNYVFGGSLLDTAPYQLRSDVPATQPQSARNTFGFTFGGPFKIPGLYEDTARRSSFQANYNGNRSNNVFNRYATVPTDAMRSGNFSASPIPLVDPATGLPFPNNQIPLSRMNGGALALLPYIPRANLPGIAQNYQTTSLTHSSSDDVTVRFTQNLSPSSSLQAGGGGRGGGGRGAFGGGGRGAGGRGAGGPGGRGSQGRGTSVMLSTQLQIRRSEADQPNVFSSLSSQSSSTSITAPVSLNIIHGRTFQNLNVNLTHSSAASTNGFAGVSDVSGLAGITYPAAASIDPLNWGVPNLAFSTVSGVSLNAATARRDDRVTFSYSWMRPLGRHQLRIGGDYRVDRSSAEINGNARGSFQFTGLYTAPGAEVAGRSGADFADFLLGMPQQATLQSGGTTTLHGQSMAAFVEDNWRPNSRLTFNLGLRYELVWPYAEVDGRMANLDVPPDFSAASAVTAGGSGPFSGRFPNALIDPDFNNLGPRVGVAYRVAAGTVLRGGYSITYNNNSYAQLARQLSSQPPFTATATVLGSLSAPLFLQDALLSSAAMTTNNWGVDRGYALGLIQTWNATLTRDLSRNWGVTFTYTGTKGSDLDILRAPNRGPDGLRIPGVEAFIWESSGGRSLLNSGTVQIRRRLASGFSAGMSYTLAKSMDNASALGAGATMVAQNDQNLDAEWALSNFDRRHQFNAQATWELPWGADRHWLSEGGLPAGLFGNWNLSANVVAQSGTPLTVRVIGAASDAARGTSGSLRANYDGSVIALDAPTIGQFFNTSAFSVPPAGTFGNSARNIVIGPASHQLNAQIVRDLRLGGSRSVSISLNASNLFNTVQWAAIDTNLNSPTFGQVLSVRPMRSMTANVRVRF